MTTESSAVARCGLFYDLGTYRHVAVASQPQYSLGATGQGFFGMVGGGVTTNLDAAAYVTIVK